VNLNAFSVRYSDDVLERIKACLNGNPITHGLKRVSIPRVTAAAYLNEDRIDFGCFGIINHSNHVIVIVQVGVKRINPDRSIFRSHLCIDGGENADPK
jgi:hypothetical protein